MNNSECKRMTGLECLKKEMMERGFTKQQTESKTVLGVLDILSSANGKYSDMNRLEQEIKLLEKRKSNLWNTCNEYERKAQACKHDLEQITQAVNELADKRYNDTIQYIEKFFGAIDNCETPEARDALKMAQMFVNTVNIDSKYDNTAFIIGLATIISQGHTEAIDKLRTINKKIPKVKFEAMPYIKYNEGSCGWKDWKVTNTRTD